MRRGAFSLGFALATQDYITNPHKRKSVILSALLNGLSLSIDFVRKTYTLLEKVPEVDMFVLRRGAVRRASRVLLK